jgi:hypothetical protein
MNISITYNTTDPITRETISVTKSIIITIPDGNYNSSDLIATILALLLANVNSDGSKHVSIYNI